MSSNQDYMDQNLNHSTRLALPRMRGEWRIPGEARSEKRTGRTGLIALCLVFASACASPTVAIGEHDPDAPIDADDIAIAQDDAARGLIRQVEHDVAIEEIAFHPRVRPDCATCNARTANVRFNCAFFNERCEFDPCLVPKAIRWDRDESEECL